MNQTADGRRTAAPGCTGNEGKKQDAVYLMTRREGRVCSFLLRDGRAVEIHCDEEQNTSLIGNIYIGKIKNIAKHLNAAFVEIAPGQVCYLPLEDLKDPVYTRKGASVLPQAGDELLVQVVRDAIKTKAPAVTTALTFHGKFALLTASRRPDAVSSKLPKAEKERLLGLVQQSAWRDPACSWLLRTNAAGISAAELEPELEKLMRQYRALMQRVPYRTCFSCLAQMPPAYLTRLSDLYTTEDVRILTDDEALYREIYDYLSAEQPGDLKLLELYQDPLLSMDKLYSLERQLSEALSERIWLKSGGYLVIQPTEALTVIDVNTGKFEGGKRTEQTFLKINREAAVELARQLRLRNLSGIIIVDFINMAEKESCRELLELLEQELRRDPIPTSLIDMTKLSLVEITRKKKEKPLADCVGRPLRS